MSIKPILFNTEMVRAILDERKTVTRRVMKPQPMFYTGRKYIFADDICPKKWKDCPNIIETYQYQPGDILYVRETWTQEYGRYYYRADFDSDYLDACETLSGGYPSECRYYPECVGCTRTSSKIRWRPSIHMPKEAARIWLKVTDVWVERLQDITVEQCVKEGIWDDYKTLTRSYHDLLMQKAYPETFKALWDSTIKKSDLDRYGWDANPWVWVIEFEQCEKPKDWK